MSPGVCGAVAARRAATRPSPRPSPPSTSPRATWQAFVHGEASAMALSAATSRRSGVPRPALSISGYWKRTRT